MNGYLGVVEASVSCSTVASYFQTFAEEEILLEGCLCFVIDSCNHFGFFPGYGAGSAVPGMFTDDGNILIGFVGRDVGGMMAHAGAEGHSSLSYTFCVWVATTGQLVDALLVETIRTSLFVCT